MPGAALSPPPPATGIEEERRRIVALVAGASLETAARRPADIEAYRDRLDAGSDVYVNHLPGESYHEVIAVAARLARAGFNPVPHLGARNFTGFTQLRDCIERLAGEAGVRQVLAIAGDVARPAGPYPSSLEMLATGLLQKSGILRAGIAGYPEQHARIGNGALWEALRAKVALGRGSGIGLYLVTQFCFEALPILAWIARLRASGIDLPVRVGLSGPASLRTLLAYALRCGIGPSARALGADAASIAHLVTQTGPEPILRALAAAPEGRQEIAGLHFFPFGGVLRTAAWQHAIAEGRFRLEPGGGGFRVDYRS
ncbi:MAG TPA: methylenetetrahydrofolate reductase [Stellaceae bacterium]|nr:methylenetetrahydrofolate reductase [Stellaceae bacterium]